MANSFVRYTGDNSTTAYSIPFSYRTTGDLTVTISGSATTAFTLNAAGTTLTFNSAPAQDAAIEIRRKTSQTTKLVDYASGSVLTENDLDTDSDQAFFMGQEAIDDANDVIKISNTNFQYDATNKRITNVADPVNAQDLATKNYLENTFLTTANKTALTTVNANIANINAVNSNATNINSAVSNATNINTVATNIGSVNTVATDIAKVIAVANDLAEAVSEVETVADDLNEATSEIDTVATSITNVDTVGTNIANVNTVAGISSNVTTVAGNNSNVSTVAGISGNVTTVAGISSDVTTVAGISSDITTVRGINLAITNLAPQANAIANIHLNLSNVLAVNTNSANINTVAGNNSNISTVAGVSSDVTTVAGISSDVQAVENIASNVTTVAGISTAINSVNSNSSNINTVAGAITNVNNVGGSIANVNTVAGNLSGVNSFGERYRVSSSAPSSSLDVGDLYFDTTANELKVYKSSGWANAGSTVNGTSQRFNYTATNGQTTFTGSDNNGNTLGYDAGFIDVYLNGVKLLNGTDVTVTSGSSVVLASGATTGDVVDIVAYGTFSVASLNASNLSSGTVPDARITGAYTGVTNLNMSGILTADEINIDGGGTIHSTNNTSSIAIGGGTNSNVGANITLYSGNHSSLINVTRFGVGSSETARFNSSGDLFISKTTNTIADDGHAFTGSFASHTVSNNVPLYLNRKSSDGTIQGFRKDDTTVGSIASNSGSIELNSQGSSLKFSHLGTNVAFLTANNFAPNADNAMDLGYDAGRFNDLYLGGGAYLGGTGSANKLDDYEEGTWTPTLSSGTCNVSTATYTKIGNQCTIAFSLNGFSDTSTTTDVIITGLPFTQPSNTETAVGSAYGERTNVNKPTVELNSNNLRFRNGFGSSTFDTPLKYADINNGADLEIRASVTYQTS